MFERDTSLNRMNTIGRWKKTDRQTGLQVNLQNGSMGVKWFHDSLPWYLKQCHNQILRNRVFHKQGFPGFPDQIYDLSSL